MLEQNPKNTLPTQSLVSAIVDAAFAICDGRQRKQATFKFHFKMQPAAATLAMHMQGSTGLRQSQL